MSTVQYDWTQFAKQVFIRAELSEVFRAWTTPAGIVKWFIAQAEYTAPDGTRRDDGEMVQAGDRYFWRWHQDVQMRGEVLAVEPNRLLQFTFGDKTPGGQEKIVVTIHFAEEPDGASFELVQDNMADTPDAHVQWHLSCNLGWSFFMTNLKALLEHGVDLRETSRERANAARAVTH